MANNEEKETLTPQGEPSAKETSKESSPPPAEEKVKKDKKTLKSEKKVRWQAHVKAAKEAKAEKRQKKKLRKVEKKAKKREWKKTLKDAPFRVKFWHVFLKKFLIVLAVLIVAFFAVVRPFLSSNFFKKMMLTAYYENLNNPVEQEKIDELSPKDTEGESRINTLEKGNSGDTWTICYYMIGSNLESMGGDELSDMTSLLTKEISETNKYSKSQNQLDMLKTYAEDLKSNGLDIPEYLYEPTDRTKQDDEASSAAEDLGITRTGAATNDLGEITSDTWSDNINIVIQTGGAKKWSNSVVNPNKTQRFEYKNGNFTEVENMPLQDSCDPDTLSDFLSYCDTNYPADHRILVLWDHGGGAMGYGSDEIYGSAMSLTDLQTALSKNYEADAENPHFDLIGFDACLMASTETAHSLYGYGKYLAASEEVENGDGWNHSAYLKALSDDPSMNPAAIGEVIADSFMDYYMTQTVNSEMFGLTYACEFSVIDINEAENTYQAYSNLNARLLKDSISDISVLSTIGNAAEASTRYATSAYQTYNLIDLGNYMTALSAYYPEECQAVLDSIDKAVLYHRANSYLSDSTGLNIYMPVETRDASGIVVFLTYVNSITDNMDTKALYYYKTSGCLNEELQAYADSKGYGTAKTLDTNELKKLPKNAITITDNGFDVTLTKDQLDNTQSARMQVSIYDENGKTITYYGESTAAEISDDGTVHSNFTGNWIMMDGIPLYCEVYSESPSAVSYRSPVTINDTKYYLTISCDRKTGELTLIGATPMASEVTPEAATAYVIDKTTIELESGDIINPIYSVYDTEKGTSTDEISDESIVFNSKTKLETGSLPDGTYLNTIVLRDIRGDEYYTGVVKQDVTGGKVSNQEVSAEFYGTSR